MGSSQKRSAFLQSAVALALTLPATEAIASPIRLLGSPLPNRMYPTVYNAINRIPDLSTLAELLSLVGLDTTLNSGGPFTVFAPPNEAWLKLPKNQLAKLMNDPARLMTLLTYHVLPQSVYFQHFVTGKYTTVQGDDLEADVVAPGIVTINRTPIAAGNVKASNGVIHIVGKVLTKVLKQSN
jgi:uncharacterized surface protein with fasciclin (FAS1) repeats